MTREELLLEDGERPRDVVVIEVDKEMLRHAVANVLAKRAASHTLSQQMLVVVKEEVARFIQSPEAKEMLRRQIRDDIERHVRGIDARLDIATFEAWCEKHGAVDVVVGCANCRKEEKK